MGRHGENIFKRKDGRWEARFPCGQTECGKTKYKSVYGKSYRDAKNARQLMLAQQEQTKNTSETFSAVLLQWLESKRADLKEQSWAKYERCISKHINPCLGGFRMDALTTELVQQFLGSKLGCASHDTNQLLSPTYVRLIATILQSVLNYAFENEKGIKRPIKLQKPKPMKKHITVLSRREQYLLESYLFRDLSWSNLAIFLSLHTGLRIGEVCALRWEDIDLFAQQLSVKATVARIGNGKSGLSTPKSNSAIRVIPLSGIVTEALSDYKRQAVSPFVFPASRTGMFMNPRTLQNRFKAALKESNVQEVNFHALRHTFATRWVECGMDMKSLSEILGHANVKITMDIYVHSSDSLKRSGMERLERFSSQNSGHSNRTTIENQQA